MKTVLLLAKDHGLEIPAPCLFFDFLQFVDFCFQPFKQIPQFYLNLYIFITMLF